MLLELKWFHNEIIEWSEENDIEDYSTKDCKTLRHYDENGNMVEEKVVALTSSVKQAYHERLVANQKSIDTLNERGRQKNKGELGYTDKVTSIPYKQYGNTHEIKRGTHVRLQGMKKPFRVRGLQQFYNRRGYEVTTAVLKKTPLGIYIFFTVYIDKGLVEEPRRTTEQPEEVGLDFGCTHSFNFSDGTKVDVKVEEPKRLKTLQEKLGHQIKGSKAYERTNL